MHLITRIYIVIRIGTSIKSPSDTYTHAIWICLQLDHGIDIDI